MTYTAVKSVLQILLTLREARDVCLNYRLGDIHLFPGFQWRMQPSTVYMSASTGTVLTSDAVSRASSRCTFGGASCWRSCPRQECLPEVPCLLNGRSNWWGIWSERLKGVRDKRLRLVLSWTRSIMVDGEGGAFSHSSSLNWESGGSPAAGTNAMLSNEPGRLGVKNRMLINVQEFN
jgi:hypothetical protein